MTEQSKPPANLYNITSSLEQLWRLNEKTDASREYNAAIAKSLGDISKLLEKILDEMKDKKK